jgi:riboflavin synthase
MFTGLIQAVGTIAGREERDGTLRLTIEAASLAPQLAVGDSIAVSGVCLTALDPRGNRFFAELAAETVARTSLAHLATGSQVNLELPTPAGTPLGGHVVQGHVDATGTLLALERVSAGERTDWVLRIAVPPAVGRFVVEKGSIAIEGISLTVARWLLARFAPGEEAFGTGELHVAIIPHTYQATNLHRVLPGAAVNLEADVLMKLAVQNGLVGPPAASAISVSDQQFEVTLPYLIANGY